MLGHQVRVLAEPVAGALDLHDDGVMQQPVEQRCGDHGVAEHLAPFGETEGDATSLLHPAAEDTLLVWPVSTRVNRPANNDADLLALLPPA